jgi:hypothetical protein
MISETKAKNAALTQPACRSQAVQVNRAQCGPALLPMTAVAVPQRGQSRGSSTSKPMIDVLGTVGENKLGIMPLRCL